MVTSENRVSKSSFNSSLASGGGVDTLEVAVSSKGFRLNASFDICCEEVVYLNFWNDNGSL